MERIDVVCVKLAIFDQARFLANEITFVRYLGLKTPFPFYLPLNRYIEGYVWYKCIYERILDEFR